MRVLFRWLLVLLFLLTVGSAYAQEPAQVTAGVNALGAALGRPLNINDMTSWRYRIEIWQDTALGCPSIPAGAPLTVPAQVYIVTLDYQGTVYEYRTTENGGVAFFCGSSLPATPTPLPPTPTLQPGQPVPTIAPTFDPSVIAAQTCPPGFAGFLPPRLQVGAGARIEPGGTPNRIRELPNLNSTQIGIINPGSTAQVVGGPSCDAVAGIIWWQVQFNSMVGWTAEGFLPDEYFVEPTGIVATSTPFASTGGVSGSVGEPLPDERSLITILNALQLEPLSQIALEFVTAIAFAPDTSILIVGTLYDEPVAYQLPNLAIDPIVFAGVPAGVSAIAFSGDGRSVAFGTFTGQLFVFDMQSETTTELPAAPNGQGINALAFSPDDLGYLAVSYGTAFNEETTPGVSVYYVPGEADVLNIPTDAQFGAGIAYNVTGDTLFVADTALHTYSIDTGEESQPTLTLEAPGMNAIAVTLNGGGQQRIAFSDGSIVRVFGDALVEERTLAIPGAAQRGLSVLDMAFAPESDLLAVASGAVEGNPAQGGEVTLYDIVSDPSLVTIPVRANALAFSPDGSLLVLATPEAILFYGIS